MEEAKNEGLFLLQGFDTVTNTVAVEWRVRINDREALRSILGLDTTTDPNLTHQYDDLSEVERKQIGALCDPPFVPDPMFTGICRSLSVREEVPYLIHTDFELPLMIDGRKPLSVFMAGHPSEDWFEEYLGPFEPFVASGQILRRVVDTPIPTIKKKQPGLDGMRTVFFVLPGHEWRVDSYVENILNRTGAWNEGLERLQGLLLGYEDWQNDWWIQHRLRPAQQAG